MKRLMLAVMFMGGTITSNGQDLVSGGDNSWIFHTPDDGRKSLEIAPLVNGAWSFGKFTLSPTGSLTVPSLSTQGLRSNSWQPFGSASDDLYVDVIPGTRILRTRNWNTTSPNVLATGIQTGGGYFEGNVGVGTTSPTSRLQVGSTTISNGAEANSLKIFSSKSGNETSAIELNQLWNGNVYTAGISAYVDSYWGPASAGLLFKTAIWNGTAVTPINSLYVRPDGFVGVGTMTPKEQLSVNGKIRAQEIKVEAGSWPDYVFAKEYELKSLSDIEKYIKINGHLPEIPNATEVQDSGVELGEMNAKLLKKIEELTLHLINQDKEIRLLKDEVRIIQKRR